MLTLPLLSGAHRRSRKGGTSVLENLDAVEIIGPISSGMTEPFQCRLSDDQLYAVKGRGALTRGLIAEAACARLGQTLRLPIPSAVFCFVDGSLSDASNDASFQRSVGPGWCFGSLWKEPAVPLQPSMISTLDRRLMAKIYAFDHWVRNGDRTLTEQGGNPNLIVQLEGPTLFAIDHNLAFSGEYDPTELEWHAGRQAWLHERHSLVFVDECRRSMTRALADFGCLRESLPTQWTQAEPTFFDDICLDLERCETAEFWMEMG